MRPSPWTICEVVGEDAQCHTITLRKPGLLPIADVNGQSMHMALLASAFYFWQPTGGLCGVWMNKDGDVLVRLSKEVFDLKLPELTLVERED